MQPDTPIPGDQKTAFNRRRATRRREVARTINGIRSTLGVRDGLQTSFEGERRHLFASTRLSAAFAVPMLALIVTAISTLWLNTSLVSIWFAITLSMHFLMVFICRAYENAPSENRAKSYWIFRFTAGDFAYASC
jgi:two-component system cell cycle sensor histidine kinase PleC